MVPRGPFRCPSEAGSREPARLPRVPLGSTRGYIPRPPPGPIRTPRPLRASVIMVNAVNSVTMVNMVNGVIMVILPALPPPPRAQPTAPTGPKKNAPVKPGVPYAPFSPPLKGANRQQPQRYPAILPPLVSPPRRTTESSKWPSKRM